MGKSLTQVQMVAIFLRDKATEKVPLVPLEALVTLGVSRLGARIKNIKDDGVRYPGSEKTVFPIVKDRWVEVEKRIHTASTEDGRTQVKGFWIEGEHGGEIVDAPPSEDTTLKEAPTLFEIPEIAVDPRAWNE